MKFRFAASEGLLVWRKRKGLTQAEAAKAWGVSVNLYRLQEAGRKPAPKVPFSRFKKREVCLIKRRRMGWTQNELAEVLGVSEIWVKKMEAGTAPIALLYNYWTE